MFKMACITAVITFHKVMTKTKDGSFDLLSYPLGTSFGMRAQQLVQQRTLLR